MTYDPYNLPPPRRPRPPWWRSRPACLVYAVAILVAEYYLRSVS